jgi:DNA-binding NtrC family response regulator
MAGSDVLIVDDDDATRDGLRELLALAGFSVETEQDGVQALESIRGHDVKVVLLDVLLPGLGGLDVLARCAEERRRAKIIIMTGWTRPRPCSARCAIRRTIFFRSRSNLRH